MGYAPDADVIKVMCTFSVSSRLDEPFADDGRNCRRDVGHLKLLVDVLGIVPRR